VRHIGKELSVNFVLFRYDTVIRFDISVHKATIVTGFEAAGYGFQYIPPFVTLLLGGK